MAPHPARSPRQRPRARRAGSVPTRGRGSSPAGGRSHKDAQPQVIGFPCPQPRSSGATGRLNGPPVRRQPLLRRSRVPACSAPPARTHTFAALAAAIDDAFSRWDRAHLHEFRLADGTRLTTPYGDDDELGPSLDDRRTRLSRLRPGEPFLYTFDLGAPAARLGSRAPLLTGRRGAAGGLVSQTTRRHGSAAATTAGQRGRSRRLDSSRPDHFDLFVSSPARHSRFRRADWVSARRIHGRLPPTSCAMTSALSPSRTARSGAIALTQREGFNSPDPGHTGLGAAALAVSSGAQPPCSPASGTCSPGVAPSGCSGGARGHRPASRAAGGCRP